MAAVVHILILAAGASSRMRGGDKLLLPVGHQPLLRHVARGALGTGAPVTVTLPSGATARRKVLADLPVRIVEVPDAALGMSRSLVRGMAAVEPDAGPEDGVMILPADMPGFTTAVLADLIARFRADPDLIIRGGTLDGQPGHPAIFPRDLWPELARVTGDEGGRSVLRQSQGRIRVIPLPDRMALLDLDTPEDWAAWRAAQG
ncbi:NTP transferase domain-containing protein [Tabrizicola sp. YIM 78059]|uniref:nucleotidyltransferase family protein n=1 Tax=Tabrizicola sp. YIM 78059 TaxID=2529861 RepID=UPI0010AB3C25|nr:nucleotidyltransferase family protein [Tabrizicola sp. YIM 78059]